MWPKSSTNDMSSIGECEQCEDKCCENRAFSAFCADSSPFRPVGLAAPMKLLLLLCVLSHSDYVRHLMKKNRLVREVKVFLLPIATTNLLLLHKLEKATVLFGAGNLFLVFLIFISGAS